MINLNDMNVEPPRKRRAQMIRVDHAGEYGAVAIYRGQRAVFERLGNSKMVSQIVRMEADEQAHLDAFDVMIQSGQARPTALMPIWKLAGYGLGVVTALLGEKSAHACTEAVESVIETHYTDQIEELQAMEDQKLASQFTKFRDEEVAHKEFATENGAAEAPGYRVLSQLIKMGCHAAIKISTRI